MSIEISDFGKCANGKEAKLFTLTNSNNITAKLTNFGAVLVSLFVPDKNGKLADVVLGFDNIDKYSTNDICYFGSTVGRNSNRVKEAKFTLNGVTYNLDKNERNKNNLHSGFNPYNERLWNYDINENNNSVSFSLVSPDGDQGFPGEFKITVTYTLTNENELKIDYSGKSDKDTIANMTNHSYFNLAGHNSGTAMEQELYINSDKFVEVDDELIPTGNLIAVQNTPLDFRTPKKISLDINKDFEQLKNTCGFDHSFLINKTTDGIEKIATLSDEKSGRVMDVYTDSVAVQFYAGNFIENNTVVGKENCLYKNRSGICLETGFLPDSMNQKNFKSPVLKAGDEYRTTTIYKFSF
ncbi:MAG: galactose mutarotase [Clostridia bacterium]|nr:galactose mutarotase [Clostridia bacterium]